MSCYAKEPICHGITPSGFTVDVIVIEATNIQAIDKSELPYGVGVDEDPLAYFTSKVEEFNSVIHDVANLTDKPKSAIPPAKLIKVNDYFGIAREPMKACTVVIFHDKDGSIKDKVVEEQDVMRAGFLEFYHSRYSISNLYITSRGDER